MAHATFTSRLALLAALVLASQASRQLTQEATSVRLCIPTSEDEDFVASCTSALSRLNTAQTSYSCVLGGSLSSCNEMMKAGTATLTRMGATDMYNANREFGFVPLVSELYGDVDEGASYYAVAVVPASMCNDPDVTLASLAGKRSCHTGYGRTAGWSMPVGFMTESGKMPVSGERSDVKVDAQTVASFFSETWAPGTSDEGPMEGGKPWDKLCTACKGDCSEADPYADYEGALRCVMEGAADVAFTKHNIPLEYAADGSSPADWSTMAKADLRLMCPGGGCAAVDDYTSCTLARVPAGALVGPGELQGSQLGKAIQQAFEAAAKNASFVNTTKPYVFSESTTSIKAQTQPLSGYFAQETLQALAGKEKLDSATPTTPSTSAGAGGASEVKLCIPDDVSEAFVAACTKAMAAANTQAVKFSCMAGGSEDGCSRMVKSGAATITKLGATQQYDAYREFGLVPVVTENYGDAGGASYYAVAVVPASMCNDPDVTLASLAGKRSCHTGYGRTAGWTMPTGFLAEAGIMPLVDAEAGVKVAAQSVASFFSQTCAAGTTEDGPSTGGKPWDKLCTACKGDCSEIDPYADYEGALRCVMEGAGDVAFTKHNIPLEFAADGSSPADWSTMAKADLRLMCPDGGCAAVDDYASCTLARVATGAIVGAPELQGSQLGKDIQQALVTAAAKDGSFLASTKSLMGTPGNLIFADSTVSLQAQSKPFEEYFTKATMEAIEGAQSLEASSASASADDGATECSGGGSSGVSSGVAAGIGIGCAVGGVLIAAIVTAMVMKKKSRWAVHLDEGTRVMSGDTHATKAYI